MSGYMSRMSNKYLFVIGRIVIWSRLETNKKIIYSL